MFDFRSLSKGKLIWRIFLAVAFLTCVLKYAFRLQETGKEVSVVRTVRLDGDVLTPISIAKKRAEVVISVNADDIDDILDKSTGKVLPQVPHILLHDPFRCKKTPNLSFILYVHSSPLNKDRRDLLRQTYANTNLFKYIKFTVVFLLGLPKSYGVQEQIKKEFDEHGDIVQGYFIDDYRNITVKAVMGLQWISNHCKEAAYAIKVDDDTFMNIFDILPLLEQNSNKSLVLICPIWREGTMRILRERKSCMKWCVTKKEFPGEFYPRYCAGIGYILSRNLVRQLQASARTTPFFWIDDVYVTGLLTQRLVENIHYIDLMSNFTANEKVAMDHYANKSLPISTHLIHVRDKDNFIPLWKHLLSRLEPKQRHIIDNLALNKFI